ncbi:MAG: hypothetical protein Q8Q12_20480 [bacterium]|nr:hypothetical protein [bacterium]
MARKEHKGRTPEQEAVRTTIVGARPPGSGKSLGDIPRGIEVLVKKASVDAEFRNLLVEKRSEAAKEIELELGPAEVLMLNAVPRGQLEAIIANTKVSETSRRAFLGRAAAVMLAALGASTLGCRDDDGEEVKGTRPDRPEDEKPAAETQVEEKEQASDDDEVVRGIRPDRPKPKEQAAEDVKSEG